MSKRLSREDIDNLITQLTFNKDMLISYMKKNGINMTNNEFKIGDKVKDVFTNNIGIIDKKVRDNIYIIKSDSTGEYSAVYNWMIKLMDYTDENDKYIKEITKYIESTEFKNYITKLGGNQILILTEMTFKKGDPILNNINYKKGIITKLIKVDADTLYIIKYEDNSIGPAIVGMIIPIDYKINAYSNVVKGEFKQQPVEITQNRVTGYTQSTNYLKPYEPMKERTSNVTGYTQSANYIQLDKPIIEHKSNVTGYTQSANYIQLDKPIKEHKSNVTGYIQSTPFKFSSVDMPSRVSSFDMPPRVSSVDMPPRVSSQETGVGEAIPLVKKSKGSTLDPALWKSKYLKYKIKYNLLKKANNM